jgi:hypothetical protein
MSGTPKSFEKEEKEIVAEIETVLSEVPALIVEVAEDLTLVGKVVSVVDPKVGVPIAEVASVLTAATSK